MLKNLMINKVVWVITSVLVLLAGTVGVTEPTIYQGLVSENIIAGIFTQDLIAVLGAFIVMLLACTSNQGSYRKLIIITGILGFFFYAYGIYAIEQVYNRLYPVYLAIFSASTFGIILSLASLDTQKLGQLELPGWLRTSAAGYGIFIAIMFNFIWLGQLIPLLRTGNRIEYTFSIFIIDLCFVMPAFVISAVMTLRHKPLGQVGLPALFTLGVGILSPLALAEFIKPMRFGLPADQGQFWLYFVLSLLFAVWAAFYLWKYSVEFDGVSSEKKIEY